MTFKALQMAQVRRAVAERDRAAWKAVLEAAARTLAAAAVSAALSLGAWEAWQWATASEAFAVRSIRFQGLSHAREADLLQRSGLKLGANLFRADLSRAARAMEGNPWVSSAHLARRLPGEVLASIVEHKAAALVRLGGLYVLDEEGEVFKRAAPDDALDLPIVTGIPREAWAERKPEAQLRIFGALHLLDAWRSAGFAIAAVSEVRLDEDGGFTVFAHDGTAVQEVRLGASDISLKLRRLAQVRAALARRGERAARIDLDNPARPDQAAATLADKR
ncbi:MAG TPA: cell division protein FtsQ/DivIB [Myxococcales bacterium]|nr:cell division protein FtsQ/DivIB [Myxococcales bacterium]